MSTRFSEAAVRQGWTKPDFEFDWVAEHIFAPIYPVIARDVLSRTPLRAGRVMDLGCGGGHLGFALMGQGAFQGYFVDVNQTALDLARQRARERGLAGRAFFCRQDVHTLDFPDGFAQLMVSRGSFHFWGELDRALGEIYRVLAPGGLAYIGGGLGNRALKEQITARMQDVRPGWPDCVFKRSARVPTARIRTLLDDLDIPYEILENEDQGRWIIMRK